MGISLRDLKRDDHCFDVNFWNWRPIVEIIRRIEVLPDERARALHEPFCGHGLSQEEARLVADAIEARVLPSIRDGERMLLDGSTTTEPDDGTFHKIEPFRNYSTTRGVIERFIAYCRSCAGFEVL